MSTLAWVLILAALIISRSVAKGRALNIGQDLSDAFRAIVTGQTDDFMEVLGRKGDTATAYKPAADAVAAAIVNTPGMMIGAAADSESINGQIVYWARKLGSEAKGYRWGKAGPDYYDCSGLMYAALKHVGYKGYRFYTATMLAAPGMVKVSSPLVGDFVLWPGHHVGVYIGSNRIYAARSVKRGIGESNIDETTKSFGASAPIYVRWSPHA